MARSKSGGHPGRSGLVRELRARAGGVVAERLVRNSVLSLRAQGLSVSSVTVAAFLDLVIAQRVPLGDPVGERLAAEVLGRVRGEVADGLWDDRFDELADGTANPGVAADGGEEE